MPRFSALSLFTLLGCTLLNACSWWIGDIPGPIDPRADTDGAAPPSSHAGVGDAGANTVDMAGGRTDASVAPNKDAASTEGAGSNEEGTPPGEDTSASGEDLPDAAPNSIEDAASSNEGTTEEETDPTPCDRDGDGAESEDCGGADCDDDDPDVHPGQTRYFIKPNEHGGFDYNCSGLIERDPAEASLSCALELAQCDLEAQGFLGEALPACGEPGDWGQCVREEVVGLPGMCNAQKLETRRAACR